MDQEASLRKLARTEVIHEIPPTEYLPVLTNSPFVWIEGTFNSRDLGDIPRSPLRSNFIYRSGGLARLTEQGKEAVTALGVKRIFDLRSPEERGHAPDPDIEGVENTWIQSLRPDSTPDLTKFIPGKGEAGYEDMYLEVIEVYQPAWRAILEHIRDRPNEAFLVHCTAGRDRTGVISGLLLTLAGAAPDVVSLDYMLSRIGTEPVRETLLQFALAGCQAESIEQPGFQNLCELREESWSAFVKGVERDFGGFEKFVTGPLGFTVGDLTKIKANLVKM
ncbi:hypothetical protein E8E14_013377 [Neopestalotiopsis sp. 37M]|nr:hypothetical protein E8E14_013377 [Neopestalotiopsis sp. 37M]